MRKRSTVAALLCLLAMSWPLWVAADDPDGDCEENGPQYGEWYLGACPALNNSPSVVPTQLYGNVNEPPCLPAVVAPAYAAGIKHRDITYDCTDPETENADITFDASEVKWEPPVPEKWVGEGIFQSTAYVDITGGDDQCPPPGRYDIGIVTWMISGKWHELGAANISAVISAIKTAIGGVKKAASVGPCDVGEMKLNGEIKLWRRTLYCDCRDPQTRMASKVDPAKMTLTLSKIECPIPTLCLPPLKLGKAGKAAAGVYATYSGSWDLGVKVQVAQGCQNDNFCAQVDGKIEAGFKVKAEVCYKSGDLLSAKAEGGATSDIGLKFECCHNGPGSFSVQVQPLKLAYQIQATVVGWKKTFAKGEFNIFKGGQLGPYSFDCPI